MKLAEGLIIRSDLQTRLDALRQRIQANMLVQEGETPAENPQALLAEAAQTNRELHHMIARIHRTNAHAVVGEKGQTMLDLLMERDRLTVGRKTLQNAIDSANSSQHRYSSAEIRWVKTADIGALQKECDDISAQIRQINLTIQAANWQTELAE